MPRKISTTTTACLIGTWRYTRYIGSLTVWMQTTGAVLLTAKWCSLARVLMPAQDSRSAYGLLYLAAVPSPAHEPSSAPSGPYDHADDCYRSFGSIRRWRRYQSGVAKRRCLLREP